jgi:hypothetical protein
LQLLLLLILLCLNSAFFCCCPFAAACVRKSKVPLSERVFDVVAADGPNEWVAFRLRSSAHLDTLNGRYVELGPPPDLNLRLQAAAAAGAAAPLPLADNHGLHFRLEGPRRHRHHATAPRGVLRHRATNAFVGLVPPGTWPLGTLRGDPLARRADATVFALNGTTERAVAAAAREDAAARALDAAQLAAQVSGPIPDDAMESPVFFF